MTKFIEFRIHESCNPQISVVIPTYNSSKIITETLKSLIQQSSLYPYEIIIVDDGSTDGTPEVIRNFLRKVLTLKNVTIKVSSQLTTIKIFLQNHKGPATVRNLGIKMSKGEYIVFLDADCVPPENWLIMITKSLLRCPTKVAGIGGTYKTLNRYSNIARYVGYEIAYRHSKIKKEFIDFIGTFCSIFRRKVILEIGGFDETFKTASAEDTDLCYRIIEKGYLLRHDSRIWVWHKHPDTFKRYFKQQVNRAKWRVLLVYKHIHKVTGDSYVNLVAFIQPFYFTIPIIVLMYSLLANRSINLYWLSFSLTTLLLLTLISNMRFLLWIYKKENKSIKFLLLALFLCLMRNLAWLVGFVLGIKLLMEYLCRGKTF